MTTTIRRFTAAVALPAALLFTFTACGGDDGDSGSDDTSSESNESTESDDSDAAASPEAEETEAEGGEMPEAGSIPDPVNDPEGFEAYLADMYVDAGMTDDQADCMAGAFMDNVDLAKANDPSAITELMNDPALQEAMTSCV